MIQVTASLPLVARLLEQLKGPKLLVLLFLFVSACACPLQDRYAARLRTDQELLKSNFTPASIDPPADHVGIFIKEKGLNRILRSPKLLKALPRFATTMAIPIKMMGIGTLKVSLELGVLDIKVSPSDRCETCLTLDVLYGGHVSLKIPALKRRMLGLKERYRLDDRLRIDAKLKLVPKSGGVVAVNIDLSDAAYQGMEAALRLLPSSLRPLLTKSFSGTLEALARSTLSKITLFHIPSLKLGSGLLKATVSTLKTDAQRQEIYLGLMLSLAIPPSPAVPQSHISTRSRSDLRFAFAGDLPQSLLQVMMSDGVIPRRHSTSLKPQKDGPLGVTVEKLHLNGNDLIVRFKLWHLESPCFLAALSSRGRISKNKDGKFFVQLDEIKVEDSEGWAANIVEVELWNQAPILNKVAKASVALLNEQLFSLPNGIGVLGWRTSSWEVSPALIAVEGHISLQSK